MYMLRTKREKSARKLHISQIEQTIARLLYWGLIKIV